MSDKLNKLNETLRFQVYESTSDKPETEEENKDQEDVEVLGIRRSTTRLITGRVNKDFDWEIDYDILRKAICDEVITVDLSKTKKIFKLIKDYINDKEKFEKKYS
jgi:hypothetical protein